MGLRAFAVAAMCVLSAMPVAAGTVTVSFQNPETYINADRAGGYSAPIKAETLADITRHLQRLGEKGLASDETLSIEVLNIVRPGRYMPSNPALFDVRVYGDIPPPSITLRYTLSSAGTIVSEGGDRLTDINYMTHAGIRTMGSDPLRFEKTLLDRWFRTRFQQKGAP